MISNPKAYARFAGANYFVIFALAIFANFFVMSNLLIAGDPAATAANLAEQESLFRIGVACFFIVMIADVFIAWALYYVLAPVSAPLSMLSALFRLTYTIAQIGVLLNFAKVLQINDPTGAYAAFAGDGWRHFFLAAHDSEFTLTLIFFGLHLLLLGYLIIRATFLSAVIGGLVAIAGIGYITDGFAAILFDGYGPLGEIGVFVVILPALLGEGALMVWLLIVGLNREKWFSYANSSH
ncbi:MAG: DUF4386 domain-containing protein [Pseudomonadota bacterium]